MAKDTRGIGNYITNDDVQSPSAGMFMMASCQIVSEKGGQLVDRGDRGLWRQPSTVFDERWDFVSTASIFGYRH